MFGGWTMPVQDAKFGGVSFQVFTVDDSLERAVVEHAYPFVNGADLECMGLNPLSVRMSAVFYGDGYYADFKKFLKVLEDNKPSVLVHPIRGRLQNMLCVSANFAHEAEMINYVTLDLQFREATPAKPIFMFENQLLRKIDTILNSTDEFFEQIMDFYVFVMENVVMLLAVQAKIMGYWSGLMDTIRSLQELFDTDKKRYSPSVAIPAKAQFSQQAVNHIKLLGELIQEGVDKVNNQRLKQSSLKDNLIFSSRSRFDDVLHLVKRAVEIPQNLVTGKNEKAGTRSYSRNTRTRVSRQDVKTLDLAVRLFCSACLVKIATEIIEQDDEKMTPTEIDNICTEVRLNLLDTLNKVRQLQQEEMHVAHLGDPNTGLYTASYQIAEGLRNQALQISQLAIAAINKKPPLIIREVGFNATIQQIAHNFYGDYRRADELLRLNQHIRYPNFIEQGAVLNSYAV